MDLADKVGIVTGGARGIGRGVATALARAGVDVVIGDLLEAPAIEKQAAKTLEQVGALGRRGVAVHCDVSDPAGAPALVEAALRQLGGLRSRT